MAETPITNPRGAFGYTTADDVRGNIVTEQYLNMSSAAGITKGSAVVLSSLSSQGKGVTVTTVLGDNRFIGIAMTSCGAGQTTLLSSSAPTSAWVTVAVAGGPIEALLTTATVNGDRVSISNSTVTAVNGGVGGFLGPHALATAANAVQKLAGYAHTSGSTVNEAGTTQPARGLVTLSPGYVLVSTLSTNF